MSQETIPQTNDLWNPASNAAGHPEALPQSPRELNAWGEPQTASTGSQIDPNVISMLMWAGGGLVALGVVVVGFFLLQGMVGPSSPQTFDVGTGKAHQTYVKFEKGIKVQIWVHSEHDSDVDVFVYDSSRKLIVKDEDDSRNCYVTFVPRETQTYKVVVANRIRLEHFLMERNRDNRCTLKWEQPKPAKS
jgi:hypothetical protein